MGLGMSDAAWLRRYARGVRLAARREGNPRRAAKMEDTCRRLEAAARALEAAAGERVAFADYARAHAAANAKKPSDHTQPWPAIGSAGSSANG